MRTTDPTVPLGDDSTKSADGFCYFVGHIPRSITQREVEQYFEVYGPIQSITLKRDALGNLRGYGWITYRNPPVNLIRSTPHVLKGLRLTVEPAHSRRFVGNLRPERRPRETDSRNISRRSRRSYSSSNSSSFSSSPSTSPRQRIRNQFSSSGRKSPDHGASLPPISVGNCRLPPLMGQMFSHASAAQAPDTTLNSDNVVSAGNSNSTMNMSDTYLCIPITLCPPEYPNDPRTFFAKLDPNRVGSLNIVPAPFLSTSATSAVVSMPPPPSSTSSVVQSSSLGDREARNLMSLSMSHPPSTEHGGISRKLLN